MAACDRLYDAVLMAGYPAEPDPLCRTEGVNNKAAIVVAGQPMAAHVLRALEHSGCVRTITVVGLEASHLDGVATTLRIRHIPNHQGIVDNILAATEGLDDATPVLVASSDIPLLTPEAVADFCQRARQFGGELCYSIVERSVMEDRYPGSGRSFRRTREGFFAGGDLFMATPRLFRTHDQLVRELSGQRKSAWGLMRILGLGIMLRYATRHLAIHHLEARASKLLGCACKAVISPYPELAMDVDKPHQLAIARRILASRPSAP